MDELTPIYRIEYFLDAWLNSTTPPEPIYRIEYYLAQLAGADVVIPEPIYRVEFYLAKLCGEDVEIPDPIYRVEYYYAKMCGMDVELPDPVYRIEYWLYQLAGGGDLPWQTFVGNPLEFNAPKAHTLKSTTVEFAPKQSGTGDPSPDNVRPISGWTEVKVWDDPAYGGTIRWNQLMQNGNFSDISVWQHLYSASYVVEDNVATVSLTATENSFIYQAVSSIIGHMYLITFDIKSDDIQSAYVYWDGGNISLGGQFNVSENWATQAMLYTNRNGGTNVSIRKTSAYYDVACSYYVRNFMVIDLTAMFGAGNEPATVEAFRELFPKDYYAYDATYTETTVSAVNGNPWWKSTLTFPTTVYGGSASVAEDGSGSGEDGWTYLVFDGSADEVWYDRSSGTQKEMTVAGIYLDIGAISNMYPVETVTGGWATLPADTIGYSTSTRQTFRIASALSLSDWKAFLQSNPLALCCQLATPIPFTPTVTGQPTAVAGINTMWTDGSNLTVEARGTAVNLNALQSLNILLGNRYVNNHTEEDVSDDEALSILLGGNR